MGSVQVRGSDHRFPGINPLAPGGTFENLAEGTPFAWH